jgi:hypothetical protein
VPGQRGGDPAQHLVTGIVPVGVVDTAQVVDVDHRDHQLELIAARVLEVLVTDLEQVVTVVRAGQVVAISARADLAHQVDQLDVLPDTAGELLLGERLDQEIVGATLQEARRQCPTALRRNADDRQPLLADVSAQLGHQLETVHARHLVVGDDQPDVGMGLDAGQCLLAAAGLVDTAG